MQAMTGAPDVVRLDSAADILQGLADAIRRADPHASSVHLFSHGRPGVLVLSAGEVSLETLSRDDRRLAVLRRVLAGRSLVLYGCSVGRGNAGRRFVEALSLALDAPVLASSTPTGAAARGGDWTFDVAIRARADMVPALLDPERAARWPGLLPDLDVTKALGSDIDGTLRAAAAGSADEQIVHFSNLGAGSMITLAASPVFTNASAMNFDFTGTTTSLTIGGSDIVAASNLYFNVSAGQTLTLNSGVSFSAGASVLQTTGGGTVALNGSISGTSKIWIWGGSTTEIGTTTSTPLFDIRGGSTLRFTTSGDYTSNIEIEDTVTIDTGTNDVKIGGTVTDDDDDDDNPTNVLVKTGTGTLTLFESNTASGSMTLNQGTLSVAEDDNLSAGTVTINGGTLEVTGETTINNAIALGASHGTLNVSANVTMSGVVSGTGNLTKTGASTLTLSGTNTYSGTTTVSGGALSVSTDSNLGGEAVALSGGSLTVTGATTIDNDISGTGGLTKTGTGTVTLSGTNTYSGGTTVSGGTLQVSGGNALSDTGAVTVSSGATLDLNDTNETVGSLTGSGTVDIGSGTLTLSDASASTFSGSITGTGSISGAGTYTVASGATLGGTSTFSTAVTVQSGGTIAPGNSPGKISTGNLTLASGSTANMEINGTTAGTLYDQIAVTGTVTISGATLNATVGYTSAGGDSYILIDNDGDDPVTGTFSGLAEGASLTIGGVQYTISYVGGTDNDVVLTRVATPVASPIDDGAMSGSDGADSLVGGNTADTIKAFGGDDTVSGLGGDDRISGGTGDDLLFGHDGADLIFGNQGADVIYGNMGQDTLSGGSGDDLIYAGQDNDVLFGNTGDDSLWGNLGADTLRAGDGNDLLYGNVGADSLLGEAGGDTLYGGKDADLLDGGAGDDSLHGNLGADTLLGGAGADTLVGGDGKDLLSGGDGADLIYGNVGADTLQGEAGGDTLYGGKDADLLDGGAGDDSLHGNLGADTLVGGAGADTLVGGGGNDLFRFADNDGTDVIMDFSVGQDMIGVSAGINGTGIASADDMLSRIASDGSGNAVLDLADGNAVTLIGIAPAQLDAASFLIV